MSNILIPLEENTLNDNVIKRQVATSVVHVTITAAGTVVYTHTATSYSYMSSYSTMDPTSTPTNNNNNNTNHPLIDPHTQDTKPNLGAIIGGVVGGIAFIALIGLAFLYRRRSKKKRNRLPQPGGYIDDTNSYYQPGGIDMTSSSSPAPRHLVAPLVSDANYYNKPEYYEDTAAAAAAVYPNPAFYSTTTNSLASDSLPSTTLDGYSSTQQFRQVPNLASTEERHVPHLKEHKVEPPHTKD
ncbi:hypothetical protein BD770DRAFT_383463 [Pilaira anomala]|nr:hypothetical protein BD770DRAFT_383463 [Pilaira anomala]